MIPLRVLIAEDSEDDALLVENELVAAGFAITSRRIERAEELRAELAQGHWDLVISDYSMPQFTALDALEIVRESNQPDLPFVIVSGSIGEASAVAALKAGASNYVMKSSLKQLKPVIDRELKDAKIRRERAEAFVALEQAVSARDEFLSIASHELKTPLTALRLQAEGVLRAARRASGRVLDDATVIERIQSVAHNAERLTNLIERLLDVTRIGAGPLRLSRDRIDLVALVTRVVDELADTFRAARCEVSVIGPAHVEGYWDPDRLATVIINLLTNAAKYGANKPIRIELDESGETVRMHVIDRGIGISHEHQQRIFGRFERAVPERHFGGFGVGLWLANKIVDAHGGSISVRSNAGEGSTFTVTIPRRVEST